MITVVPQEIVLQHERRSELDGIGYREELNQILGP